MKLVNHDFTVTLSDQGRTIQSVRIGEQEVCALESSRPLFTLKLLKEYGVKEYYSSLDAKRLHCAEEDGQWQLTFTDIADTNLCVTAYIRPNSQNGMGWKIKVEGLDEYILEWIEYPGMTVKNQLKGNGGDAELFWPAMEGLIIEDMKANEGRYWEIGEQSRGYCGFYPGSCPMQFMAYYGEGYGLYFAAHDPQHHPKTVEFYELGDGIVLEYHVFCNGARNTYEMPYEMIMAAFQGDWYDAAEIYRSWMKENTVLPLKIEENPRIPKWLFDSPVVVPYPIRGTIDHGDMTPNLYYPYNRILPLVDEFAKELDSRIMALPMHWEGTAPWAPPYVWPPFGGEKQFTDFIEMLHEKGNLAGVYCSGIGWTTRSFLNPQLDISDRYDEQLMCKNARGKIEQSQVLGGEIRRGYDMCPYSDKVAEIVAQEVASIAGSGCDYAQYFDQNLGGESSFCYAREHGHPQAPGIWQSDAMKRIFTKVYERLDETSNDLIIGCECAASEPFIGDLLFNDLRYNIGYWYGKPVPAYAYLFHEYLNNFMGNQNQSDLNIDIAKSADNLLFRLAYSFMAGDLFTLSLCDEGKISWAWDTPWDVAPPEQEPVFKLVKNLNRWRREYKDFLVAGKMLKPVPFEEVGTYTLYLAKGRAIQYPAILTSRWEDQKGNVRQLLVNFQSGEQSCRIPCSVVYRTTEEKEAYTGIINIPPFSAVWIE